MRAVVTRVRQASVTVEGRTFPVSLTLSGE